MNFRTLTKLDAKKISDSWVAMSDQEFGDLVENWKNSKVADYDYAMVNLRNELVSEYWKVEQESKSSEIRTTSYYIDAKFGIKLYEVLKKYGFNESNACNDDIWRYLSVILLPDIIFDKWKSEKNKRHINTERYWETTKRIWLKVIWWYVHLSFRNNLDDTWKIMERNNCDISQLIERPGKYGYKIELYREIMFQYVTIDSESKKKEHKFLSRILQLNIVRINDIEPLFMEGGYPAYVKSLFKYFGY